MATLPMDMFRLFSGKNKMRRDIPFVGLSNKIYFLIIKVLALNKISFIGWIVFCGYIPIVSVFDAHDMVPNLGCI